MTRQARLEYGYGPDRDRLPSAMTPRQAIAELLRALAVFALVMLSLAPPVVAAPAAPGATEWTLSVCGDDGAHGGPGHLPCHACRPSLAVLPPPSGEVQPAHGRCDGVAYGQPCAPQPLPAGTSWCEPRGPPAA